MAIITNAGGPGILTTDAVITLGLKMAEFSEKTVTYLRNNLDEAAAVNNPIDVIASGGPQAYQVAVEAAFQDENVDAIIVIFVPPILVDHQAVAEAIVKAAQKHNNSKTLLGCFMGVPEGISGTDEMVKNNIPLYTFPESAARALAAMIKYAHWKEKPRGEIKRYIGNREHVQRIIDETIKSGERSILGRQAMEILKAYGIPTANSTLVCSINKLSDKIAEVGFPLVMKINNPTIVHKSDVDGVVIDLRTKNEVITAYEKMSKNFGGNFSGVLLQEMIRGGVETIIGMSQYPSFGPLMMFGLGGIFVEVMKDVTFKIHPIRDIEAREMITSVKGYPLLSGFRGSPTVNLETLEEVLLRLSQLVTDFPFFESFDVNPFMAAASKSGSKAVDARFVLRE